jgi:putative hydrolase of the HAD superfamily
MYRARGVVFDLFHTLTGIESEWSDLPFTSDVLGIDRTVWNDLLITGSRWRLAGEVRDAYTILRLLAHEADPSIPEARIREAVRVRTERFRQALTRIPQENIETLRAMRAAGLKLGLVSNADVMEATPWTDSPLATLFEAAVFSCEVGAVKPEAEIYRHCLERLALSADECLYVGDGGSNELVGAREVGFSTVFVSGVMAEFWAHLIPERLGVADHHVTTIPEILMLPELSAESAR